MYLSFGIHTYETYIPDTYKALTKTLKKMRNLKIIIPMQKRVGLHKRNKQKNNLHTLKFYFFIFLIPYTKWKIKNNPKIKKENQNICYMYVELLRKHLVFKK